MEGCVFSKETRKQARSRASRLRVVWAVLLFLCFCVLILFNPYIGSFLPSCLQNLQNRVFGESWLSSDKGSTVRGKLHSFWSAAPEGENAPASTSESGIDAFSRSEKEVEEGATSPDDTGSGGRFSVRRAIKYFRWSHAAAAQLERLKPSTIYFLFYNDTEKPKGFGSHGSDLELSLHDEVVKSQKADREQPGVTHGDAASNILSAFEDVAVDFSSKPTAHVSVPRTLMHHWEYIVPESWGDTLPRAMIVEMDQGWRKYVLRDTNLNYEKLKKFEEHYYEGTLLPSLRSEPAGSVTRAANSVVFPLVGETFKRQVVDGPQDALVFFYAPWCGFCKMFEPKWNELAAQFAHISSVRFFKMDVTKNDIDHPHTRVERVPYVAFYRRERKLEAPLKMDHSVEDLVSSGIRFILENATCRDIDLDLGIDCFYEDLPGHEF